MIYLTTDTSTKCNQYTRTSIHKVCDICAGMVIINVADISLLTRRDL